MSKGTRKRESNLAKAKLKAEREAYEAKKQKVRKVTAIITISLIVLVIVAVFIGTVAYNIRMNSGEYLRAEVAAASQNHEVDGAMMTYYFNDVYNTFLSYYGSYVSYYGLDTSVSLKQQEISDGETWFEYLMEGAESNVEGILALNEAANVAGVALTEEESKALVNRVDMTDEGLYGRGVKKSDILKAKELEALAYKYQFIKQDEMTPTEAEINAEYEANSTLYQYVDYYSYSYSWTDDTDRATAEENAAALMKATDESSFYKLIEPDIRAKYSTVTDEEVAEELNFTKSTEMLYTSGDEVSEWAFGGAKAGETYLVTDEDSLTLTVYLLADEPYRMTDATKTVRQILFTAATYGDTDKAKAKAEKVLSELGNNPDENAVALAALTYSDDSGSYYNGGLYENITDGAMVGEFNDWCFDSSRKYGDVGLIETDYGWHIMYFVGDGLNEWQTSASENLISERFTEYNDEIKAAYPVSFDETVLDMIPA